MLTLSIVLYNVCSEHLTGRHVSQRNITVCVCGGRQFLWYRVSAVVGFVLRFDVTVWNWCLKLKGYDIVIKYEQGGRTGVRYKRMLGFIFLLFVWWLQGMFVENNRWVSMLTKFRDLAFLDKWLLWESYYLYDNISLNFDMPVILVACCQAPHLSIKELPLEFNIVLCRWVKLMYSLTL